MDWDWMDWFNMRDVKNLDQTPIGNGGGFILTKLPTKNRRIIAGSFCTQVS
jgi:hypothetical protein